MIRRVTIEKAHLLYPTHYGSDQPKKDVSTGPLAGPFTCSLAPLTHSLAPITHSLAPLTHFLAPPCLLYSALLGSLTSFTLFLVGKYLIRWLSSLCFFLFWNMVLMRILQSWCQNFSLDVIIENYVKQPLPPRPPPLQQQQQQQQLR